MQEIWLLTDLQWIRHSCSFWGGWVKRTKGLQRFSMLSSLAKAPDVKYLVFLLCRFTLASAMLHIELTRAELLAFFVCFARMRMHARKKTKKTTSPTCTDFHHLPPPGHTAWKIHFHSGKNSMGFSCDRGKGGWGKGDTHMGQLSSWCVGGLGQ